MLSRAGLNFVQRSSKFGLSNIIGNLTVRTATTTKTISFDGKKIEEIEIEAPFKPADTYCTPCTDKMIYPTVIDDYDSIPVYIRGKPYSFERTDFHIAYPYIPSFELRLPQNDQEVEERTPVADILKVEFADNMPTILDEDKPERDKVNFPRPKAVLNHPGYRGFIFTEDVFKSFYEKTGVTGPYALIFTFGSFLLSKEYLIIDHSVPSGVCVCLILASLVYKYGQKINDYFIACYLKQNRGWHDWQQGSIKFLENYIKSLKGENQAFKNLKILYDAKRENVQLQREAEYRKRAMKLYEEALNKANYQVAVKESKKQFAIRHMTNWIIDQVYKSITPQQQKLVLDQCIADLKKLSLQKANSI